MVNTVSVRRRPGQPRQGILHAGTIVAACALGRGSTTAFKREGDGGTPIGTHRVLYGYWRADRQPGIGTRLAMRPLRPDDGWCDAPRDANYNRPVRLPFSPSHEKMRRDDRLYDTVVVLDWNIARRARHRGSAIFFHIARPGFPPTEGCIAVSPAAMKRLLPHLSRKTRFVVHR